MSRFHSLAVREVRRETKDSVSLRFTVPDALKQQFVYAPGQYLTLRAMINGEDIRRSYSICSGLDDDALCIGIKKVDGGAFSTFANESISIGDHLDVMPPQGRFVSSMAPLSDKHVIGSHVLGRHVLGRHILGIAAGSGITPVLSIMRSVLARERLSRVTLIYGNQTSASVMFAEEIEDLKNRHLGRLSVVHVLSREAQDVALLSGRISADKLHALAAGIIDFSSVDEAFLCGPVAMVDAARTTLETLGVASARIRSELFQSSAPRQSFTPVSTRHEAEVVVSRITIGLDGKRHVLDFLESDDNLIDAAARIGLELPYSCKGGMCCTCRCKVEGGAATMAVNYSLEAWEIAAGFSLGCQLRPTTPELMLDFDQL
ncbi:MAG: 1,2-phenylacetyl-CoA epoxidase subunit PaaE [Beijerinckiaceae bacterium]